jgi:spore coat protein U-like protein
MKFTKHILASAVLLATSSFAIAATDTTDIEINVTKDAYVNLIGSLSGNTVLPLAEADVNNTTTTLGTLGTESNTVGDCDIDVTSANDFRLQHDTDSSLYLHGSDRYDIDWDGTNYSYSNSTGSFSSCNNAASDFEMNTPAISGVVQAGTYSDTLTVTVTTE